MPWTQLGPYSVEHSGTGARVAKCGQGLDATGQPRYRYVAYSPESNGARTLLGAFDSADEAKARCEAATIQQSLTVAASADEAKAQWALCEQFIINEGDPDDRNH